VRSTGKKHGKRHKLMRETKGASQPYGEGTVTNPYLKAVIMEVVEN
jgi:hypothetical protein